MWRPSGTGPWRRLTKNRPSGISKAATLAIACPRSSASRCIHTAVAKTASNRPGHWRSARVGRTSSTHSIALPAWIHCPCTRSSAVGSTATTLCPRAANAAASRPVPAPISRIRACPAGTRLSTSRWTSPKVTSSYCTASTSAARAYPAVPLACPILSPSAPNRSCMAEAYRPSASPCRMAVATGALHQPRSPTSRVRFGEDVHVLRMLSGTDEGMPVDAPENLAGGGMLLCPRPVRHHLNCAPGSRTYRCACAPAAAAKASISAGRQPFSALRQLLSSPFLTGAPTYAQIGNTRMTGTGSTARRRFPNRPHQGPARDPQGPARGGARSGTRHERHFRHGNPATCRSISRAPAGIPNDIVMSIPTQTRRRST